jgi:hypothetical protein
MRFITSALIVIVGLPVVAGAQTDSLSLTGRSNLMIGVGLTGERSTTASGGQSSVRTKGEAASFSFNHWVRPEVGVIISASLLSASSSAGFSAGGATANAIVPLLFGLSYSPRALALSSSIRPFVSAAAGPYIHTVADANPAGAENYSETVPGARIAAGANWFVARHFTVLLEANYHAVGKFERQDAVTKDPSGFGMNVGFGFAWGR